MPVCRSTQVTQPPTSEIRRLAARLKDCLDPDEVLQFLNSGCQPVQELALARLKTMQAERDVSLSLQSALQNADSNAGVINALAMLQTETWVGECDQKTLLNSVIRSRRPEVQSAVARLICRQLPEHLGILLESLSMPAARVLCFHAARGELTSDTIAIIVRWMTRRHDVRFFSPVLGLALTPRWLAAFSNVDPVLANDLAVTFGFVEHGTTAWPQEFLSQGICFVNSAMLALPLEELQQDIAAIQRHLMICSGILIANSPSQLTNGLAIDEMDLQQPLHQACFFAAVRESERNELVNRPLTSAFQFQAFQDEACDQVRFLHLPTRLLKSLLVAEPQSLAAQLSVPSALVSRFLFEYAMVQLQPNPQRTESMLYLRARWAALQLTSYRDLETLHPIKTQNGNLRFPDAIPIVLRTGGGDSASTNFRSKPSPLAASNFKVVSPCAASCLRLMTLINHRKLPEVTAELEMLEPGWADLLIPLGMEVQLPHVCDIKHVGWKELFRSIGIPSPQRPECGRMLELALPPSATWHACCHFLELIAELQIPHSEQDLAIHLSLQGDHGQIISDLCFTQLFLNNSTSRLQRPTSRMRHVMSKGLVHRNVDVVQCRWASHATCRTELRVIIAGLFKSKQGLHIDPEAVDCIRQIHLISSAAASYSLPLREIAEEFLRTLRSIVSSFPQSLQDLLAADFYESTGDYRAVELLGSLKILQLREDARNMIPEQKTDFRQQLKELRNGIADRIEAMLYAMTMPPESMPNHRLDS